MFVSLKVGLWHWICSKEHPSSPFVFDTISRGCFEDDLIDFYSQELEKVSLRFEDLLKREFIGPLGFPEEQ